jgi:hypothetical protein
MVPRAKMTGYSRLPTTSLGNEDSARKDSKKKRTKELDGARIACERSLKVEKPPVDFDKTLMELEKKIEGQVTWMSVVVRKHGDIPWPLKTIIDDVNSKIEVLPAKVDICGVRNVLDYMEKIQHSSAQPWVNVVATARLLQEIHLLCRPDEGRRGFKVQNLCPEQYFYTVTLDSAGYIVLPVLLQQETHSRFTHSDGREEKSKKPKDKKKDLKFSGEKSKGRGFLKVLGSESTQIKSPREKNIDDIRAKELAAAQNRREIQKRKPAIAATLPRIDLILADIAKARSEADPEDLIFTIARGLNAIYEHSETLSFGADFAKALAKLNKMNSRNTSAKKAIALFNKIQDILVAIKGRCLAQHKLDSEHWTYH